MPELVALSLDNPLLWLLWLAAVLVGLSKGGLPGIGMLAVPVLSLVMSPVLAAVLLLPVYILSDFVGLWLYRHSFSAENLKVLIPGGIAGVGLGWLMASRISEDNVSLAIGVLGVSFCLSRWLGMRASVAARSVDTGRGLFWGTLSGFTSFMAHAGAPPYQIFVLPQQLPKLVFAGTTTIVFAAVNLAKVIPYNNLHPYTDSALMLSLVLVPAAIAGTVLGKYLVHGLSERWLPFTCERIHERFFRAKQPGTRKAPGNDPHGRYACRYQPLR